MSYSLFEKKICDTLKCPIVDSNDLKLFILIYLILQNITSVWGENEFVRL